jgi:ABC-type transporter Mla subunit MlaD
MRRIALIATLLAVGAGALAMNASAGGDHTYRVELDNAFGLVKGSDVKVAGVIAGSIEGLSVNDAKRAVVTIGVHGPFSDFRQDATCSSEPQSLIAEYFLDCEPGHSSTPSNGFVPVQNTTTTVSNDLVQNTLREPFKQRFSLLLNEFGTALAGNPQNLNDAIRRGAPALRATRQALDILGRENKVIRDLNANSDRIIGLLAQNRANVIRFIHTAGDTATISASRRADLQQDFHLLPQFLAQLQPNLAKLGGLADQQTPLLTDLGAAAPQLTRLTNTLPPFNKASKPSLKTLGDATIVGKQALSRGRDEINQLKKAGVSAAPAAKGVADFLKALDDPRRAVEEDTRAYAKCLDTAGHTDCAPGNIAGDNCRATPADQLPAAVSDPNNPAQTVTPPPVPPQCNQFQPSGNPALPGGGYTGLQGILNYLFYQSTAVNQFDQIGHLLHFTLYEDPPGHGFSPCYAYNGHSGVPDAANPHQDPTQVTYTHNPADAHRCVAWLGPHQPGITELPLDKNCTRSQRDAGVCLPPYPGSVCPAGTFEPSPDYKDEPGTLFNELGIKNTDICSPSNVSLDSRNRNSVEFQQSQQQQSPVEILGKNSAGLNLPKVPDARKGLGGLLSVPNDVLKGIGGSGTRSLGLRSRSDPQSAGDLLNFLFGS